MQPANERWHQLPVQQDDIDPLMAIGVDVAQSGPDKTRLALPYGRAVRERRHHQRHGTMDTAGHAQVGELIKEAEVRETSNPPD